MRTFNALINIQHLQNQRVKSSSLDLSDQSDLAEMLVKNSNEATLKYGFFCYTKCPIFVKATYLIFSEILRFIDT